MKTKKYGHTTKDGNMSIIYKPKNIWEAIDLLEEFLDCDFDLSKGEEWDSEFFKSHFDILRNDITNFNLVPLQQVEDILEDKTKWWLGFKNDTDESLKVHGVTRDEIHLMLGELAKLKEEIKKLGGNL